MPSSGYSSGSNLTSNKFLISLLESVCASEQLSSSVGLGEFLCLAGEDFLRFDGGDGESCVRNLACTACDGGCWTTGMVMGQVLLAVAAAAAAAAAATRGLEELLPFSDVGTKI